MIEEADRNGKGYVTAEDLPNRFAEGKLQLEFAEVDSWRKRICWISIPFEAGAVVAPVIFGMTPSDCTQVWVHICI